MYSLSRIALLTQCRPTSRTLGCFKQIPYVKVPMLLSNQITNFSSTSKTFIIDKRRQKSYSVKFYKPNQAVKLIDTDNNVICETTYVEARKRALNENMKLFDMESDPKRKFVEFKYVTGKKFFEMSMDAKKEKKEMKEAMDDLKMKTVRLKSDIMDNDVDIKMKTAVEGLSKGHPIKVCIRHRKKSGPDERQMKEKALIDKLSEKFVGTEGQLKISKDAGILCYIYPNDSEQSEP